MKRHLPLVVALLWALGAQAITVTDTIFNRAANEAFAFGADVSFVPAMEGWGTKWLDKNGKQKDILQILKEQGINSIRLRVWTVGSGASSKQEVVAMCRRAKAKGMSVMIDFHYSDTWADPGSQTIPAAWTDHSVDALAQRVYDHTFDVLSAIKAEGVVPRWVQVGNETKRGMLYPVGQTNKGGSVAFARFVQAGYDAVKAVDESMQVIVHLPDGHDNSLYRSIFDGLKKNGAKWDIIGLSAYPRWSHLDGPTMITRTMANINDLKSRYKTPCMVVETGHYPREALIGNQYLVGLMDKMIRGGDLGCFYWEPESMGGYDMGAWDEATRKPTVMMDAFLGVKHTEVSWLMRGQMTHPTSGQEVDDADGLSLVTDMRHIRKRIQNVKFYVDKRLACTLTSEPWECRVADAEPGIHSAWAKATDSDGNTLQTDAVTFFYGRSALLGTPISVNATQKDGTASWGLSLAAAGRYRLVFEYSCEQTRGAVVWLNGDSITRTYFDTGTDAFHTFDMEATAPGNYELRLVATRAAGLPVVKTLRIFPLDGQPTPSASDLTAVSDLRHDSPEMLEVYSLSGVLVAKTSSASLGIRLGSRTSAVVALPNCVGGTPYIVRKQRLK